MREILNQTQCILYLTLKIIRGEVSIFFGYAFCGQNVPQVCILSYSQADGKVSLPYTSISSIELIYIFSNIFYLFFKKSTYNELW